MKVLETPLDAVSRDARAYPVHLLNHGDRGLCLFAAAFLGVNDAVHMARMGMRVTYVDTDEERLREMYEVYKDQTAGGSWWFGWDAWEAAEYMLSWPGMRYDVVSVDTFTGDATDRSLQTLELWCSLARRVVTATVARRQEYTVPDGWEAALYPRSPLAAWLVLTRA